jgi:hypothetical protein
MESKLSVWTMENNAAKVGLAAPGEAHLDRAKRRKQEIEDDNFGQIQSGWI